LQSQGQHLKQKCSFPAVLSGISDASFDLLHQLYGSMTLLSRSQPGKKCAWSPAPDTSWSCCLLPAWLPLPAELMWSSDEIQQKCQLSVCETFLKQFGKMKPTSRFVSIFV